MNKNDAKEKALNNLADQLAETIRLKQLNPDGDPDLSFILDFVRQAPLPEPSVFALLEEMAWRASERYGLDVSVHIGIPEEDAQGKVESNVTLSFSDEALDYLLGTVFEVDFVGEDVENEKTIDKRPTKE